MVDDIIHFLDDYPLLATTLTVANTAALICCSLVFQVIKATHLHANCRFLFTIWSLGFIAIFGSQVALSVMSFICERGFLAASTLDPPGRIYAYRVEIAAIVVTSSMEVLIVVERAISTVIPQSYHDTNQLASRYIVPLTAFTLAAAAMVGYVSAGASLIVSGCVFFSLDVLTILANTFAMRYCRRRAAQLSGHGSLNARYQVQESAEIASAMQPALFFAFLLKSTANTSFMSFCFRIDMTECIPLLLSFNWGLMEAFFMTNTIISGVFLNVWLIRANPRMRRNAEKLRAALRGSAKVASSSVVIVPPKTSETDIYFADLKRAWE